MILQAILWGRMDWRGIVTIEMEGSTKQHVPWPAYSSCINELNDADRLPEKMEANRSLSHLLCSRSLVFAGMLQGGMLESSSGEILSQEAAIYSVGHPVMMRWVQAVV